MTSEEKVGFWLILIFTAILTGFNAIVCNVIEPFYPSLPRWSFYVPGLTISVWFPPLAWFVHRVLCNGLIARFMGYVCSLWSWWLTKWDI